MFKDNPHCIGLICATFLAEPTTTSGRDSSSGLRHHAEWVSISPQLFNAHLSFSASHPRTLRSRIDPPYLSFRIFLHFWHCDIPPTLPCLPHSDKICSFRSWGGRMAHSKPLHLWGNLETPCPPWSICHHAECQEVSLGLTTGHCSPWHLVRRGKKEREREKESEGGEQRENEPDKGRETNPSHSAEPGEDGVSCQHLSLVKCSLTDNVTLITESPDSDVLSSL